MEKERREAPPQKRDPVFRLSSIDTSTPRLQPEHRRRQQSFASPAVSPSYSDHSTSHGFFSPRGGEDEDEVDDEDDVDEESHDVDERGYLYRPRSPVEMPVISTVSRSVRVESKVETRVGEREFGERRVVEEDRGLDFGGRGSVRRKWEGRNTVVFDSGLKEKDHVVKERRVVEEERSVDFRRPGVFDSGAKEEDVDIPESRVVEEERVELGDRRGWKSNAFVSDSGVKEKDVVRGARVLEEVTVELGDRRGRKSNAFVSDSSVKEKEAVRVLERGSVEFRDGRGVGVKLDARNAIVIDSSPKLVCDSRRKDEVGGTKTKTVVCESGKREVEFDDDRVVEEGGHGGGEGVEGVKPSLRRRQESGKSEVLIMRKASLCLRVLGLVMCMISFSIMAMNKNKGWALDSFDRYKEFRSVTAHNFKKKLIVCCCLQILMKWYTMNLRMC